MSAYNWSQRTNKAAVRQYLFERLRQRGVRLQSYLCLPGLDSEETTAGLCIQQAVKAGVIDFHTRILGYDWDAEMTAGIRSYFDDRYPELNLRVVTGDLLDSRPRDINYAFLDFTGSLGRREYVWMRDRFLPSLQRGSGFAITIPIRRQLGLFFHTAKRRLDADPEFKFQFTRDYYLWKNRNPEPLLATWLFVLKCLMRNYHNLLFDIVYYHDGKHTPMAVFIFEDIYPLGKEGTPYPELLRLRKEVNMPNTKSKEERSAIANKAVASRRANAEKKRRSEIAHRAVATRRANEEKRRRSETANRAVATRRANAAAAAQV
jgi:hypothetical protein